MLVARVVVVVVVVVVLVVVVTVGPLSNNRISNCLLSEDDSKIKTATRPVRFWADQQQ